MTAADREKDGRSHRQVSLPFGHDGDHDGDAEARTVEPFATIEVSGGAQRSYASSRSRTLTPST
jgi:hypothetical protein